MLIMILFTALVLLSIVFIIKAAIDFNAPKAYLYSALACSALILLYVIVLITIVDRVKNKVCAEADPYTNRCVTWVRK